MNIKINVKTSFILAACSLGTFFSNGLHGQRPADAPAIAESEQLLRDNFDVAGKQYEYLLKTLSDMGEKKRGPRTFVKGKLVNVGPKDWTSGFFPGALWCIFEYTGDVKWKNAAHDYTQRLESIKDYTRNHDLGFMIYCSYGNGWRLTRDDKYRDVMLRGAESLASRFVSGANVIRSWDGGNWRCPVIIDNMMNLEFLMWASQQSKDSNYSDIATRHAQTTLAHHFREDGSSFHLVDYDPKTGAVLTRQTVQGYANWSPWARGQAWALYGYVMMYRETRDAVFLEQAQKIAAFIIGHNRLPQDKVPYWDFDAPDIPKAPRDASAAAVIASALIELSDYSEPHLAKKYVEVARQQLLTLSSPAFRAKVGENGGFVLMHSTGFLPKKSEIDVPLNYADYYFLEALLRYRAKMINGSVFAPK